MILRITETKSELKNPDFEFRKSTQIKSTISIFRFKFNHKLSWCESNHQILEFLDEVDRTKRNRIYRCVIEEKVKNVIVQLLKLEYKLNWYRNWIYQICLWTQNYLIQFKIWAQTKIMNSKLIFKWALHELIDNLGYSMNIIRSILLDHILTMYWTSILIKPWTVSNFDFNFGLDLI